MRQGDSQSQLTRRDLLKTAAATGLLPALEPLAGAFDQPSAARSDLIRAENEKAGTTEWLGTPGRGAPSAWPVGMSHSCTPPLSLPVASVRLSLVIMALRIAPAPPLNMS